MWITELINIWNICRYVLPSTDAQTRRSNTLKEEEEKEEKKTTYFVFARNRIAERYIFARARVARVSGMASI